MTSSSDVVEGKLGSNHRRVVPPLWLLVGVLGLLVSAGFYFILWRPLQIQTNIVRDMELMGTGSGMEVGYREVGPNWLRELTGHHPYGWTKLPKVGGIFDQVVYVSAHSGVPIFSQVGIQMVHDVPHGLLVDLQQFPSLKDLYLQNTNLTDDALPLLAELKSLRQLNLENTDIWGVSLWHLQKLPYLERLTLGRCAIDNACLANLSTLKSLRTLDLHETDIDGCELWQLQKLPHLERLTLGRCAIDDECLTNLSTLKSLRSLDLHETDIDGRELWQLQKLPHLESLDLGECPIRDEYLDDLARCPSLKSLDMAFCPHLTPDAVRALGAARPDLEIHVDYRLRRDL